MKADPMHKTTDYGIFRMITSNREVDKAHLAKLMKSIKERDLLHLFPIVVNEHMEVLDGQHRLAAARKLKIPIYYMMDINVTKRDISIMNKIKKSWTLMDYINYFTIEKSPAYQELSRIINKYNEFPASTILELLSETGKRRMDEIKEGVWIVENKKQAIEILDNCRSLDNYAFYCDRSLVKAMRIAVKSGVYQHDQFLQKIEMQPRSFVKCIDTDQYVEMMEEIYNYHNSAKNKVRFK